MPSLRKGKVMLCWLETEMETRSRSLVKTISWRVIAILVTLLVAYSFLGKWPESISITIGANA